MTTVDRRAGAPGRLRIDERALGKVVGGVAREEPAVDAVLRATARHADDARAAGAGDLTVEVQLRVRYGDPVGPVAARVRERLRERVRVLTGLRPGRIDVDVSAFTLQGGTVE
jgi:uncharacterized alkaline shock family protein YloU